LKQLETFGEENEEWVVERISSHAGKGLEALFEIHWKNTMITWEPYN
jgi:hypothetical protein